MSSPEAEGDWCFWCPFRGCSSCAYKGGEQPARQGDSGAWGRPAKRDESPHSWDNGSSHGTAPTETRQRLNRGLTLTRLPTRPGGFSG